MTDQQRGRSERPNVVLAHCHDLGRFLGCYGNLTVHTPNLDALAASGVRFTNAFCTAPQCSPSRAALFTGRYPHATGVLGLTQPPFEWDLNPDERHLAAILGQAGYSTALVGVHHESKVRPDAEVAAQLGFDTVQRCGQRGEAVTELALTKLTGYAGQDRPFYLQLGYFEPHRRRTPTASEDGYLGFVGDYISPDDSLGISVPPYLVDEPSAHVELAELQGAVRYLDHQMGHILKALERLGLDDNTIVVFTTDHGLGLPRAKCSLYDPGLETALILRWPAGGWVGGIERADLVSNVDLVPTLLDACNVPLPGNLHGASLAPVAGPPASPRTEVFAEFTYHLYYDPRRCVRTDRFKLIANFTVAPSFMDSSGSWRPRTRPIGPRHNPQKSHPPLELYDLHADPLETTNLVADPGYAEARDTLLALLRSWMGDTADPLRDGPAAAPQHHATMQAIDSAAKVVTR